MTQPLDQSQVADHAEHKGTGRRAREKKKTSAERISEHGENIMNKLRPCSLTDIGAGGSGARVKESKLMDGADG